MTSGTEAGYTFESAVAIRYGWTTLPDWQTLMARIRVEEFRTDSAPERREAQRTYEQIINPVAAPERPRTRGSTHHD
jgi:hypothetical protein